MSKQSRDFLILLAVGAPTPAAHSVSVLAKELMHSQAGRDPEHPHDKNVEGRSERTSGSPTKPGARRAGDSNRNGKQDFTGW